MKATSIITRALALTVLLSATACAKRPWLDASAKSIHVGAERESDIKRMLGEPHGVVHLDRSARCAERWAYTDERSNAHGHRLRARVLFVDFDRSGVVCDVALGRIVD